MTKNKDFEFRTATKPFVENACQLVVDTYDKFALKNNISDDKIPPEIAFCKAALLDEYRRQETINSADLPKEHEHWQHRNGKVYEVLFIANQENNPTTNYEAHVVYENVESKTRWSRPLSDWHRSFGLKPLKEDKKKSILKAGM